MSYLFFQYFLKVKCLKCHDCFSFCQGERKTGTLGGFVDLPNNELGFLTCAHVVNRHVPYGRTENEPFEICQPGDFASAIPIPVNRRCGLHEMSYFGDFKGITVDASLVKITHRQPERGSFAGLAVDDLERIGNHLLLYYSFNFLSSLCLSFCIHSLY